MEGFAAFRPLRTELRFGGASVWPDPAVAHASHPVGRQEPAGRNHLGIKGKLAFPFHFAEIGPLPGPDQGFQALLPGGAHDLDLEVATAGRSPLVVRGPTLGGRAGIGVLDYGKAPYRGRGLVELPGGEPSPLHDAEPVPAQLPWRGDPVSRGGRPALVPMGGTPPGPVLFRSEERRVGKAGRAPCAQTRANAER